MTTIKHIVFDIGRVLVHWDPEIPYRRLIPDEDRRKWFLSTVCSSAWNLEQDRGRSWVEAEDELIAMYPEHAELIRGYRLNWIETISHSYQDTVAIMERLISAGHDVTLLTNFNQETYLECEEKYPFLKEPRGVTVSGRVGLIKPDPEIYHHHTEAFDLDNEATLFLDDSDINVAGAKNAGWHARLYRHTARLEADLREFNVEY